MNMNTMRSKGWRLLEVAAMLLAALVSAVHASELSTTTTTTGRDLAVYALYNIPPFSVTFRTQETPDLRAAIEEGNYLISETGQHDSSLSYPIRTITEDFLKVELEAKLVENPQITNARPIYKHMSAVDLQTKLYIVNDGTTDQTRRSLNTEVLLVAEMYGTLAFLEPSDRSSKPSTEEARELFGGWLKEIFAASRDEYLRELVQSSQELLREIVTLSVQTNIDTVTPSQSAYGEGWSKRTQKALVTMVVLLGIMGIGWMLLYLQQRHRIRKSTEKSIMMMYGVDDDNGDPTAAAAEDYEYGDVERPPAISSRERNTSLDAVRHGDDVFHRSSVTGAISVLEASDRYLSKHRPDLYTGQEGQSQFQILGRSYSIPSNPFEMIYNSAFGDAGDAPPATEFMTSPRGAFTPTGSSQRRSSMQNIAAVGGSIPFDEDDDPIVMNGRRTSFNGLGQPNGYTPFSTIWRNLSNMWDTNPEPVAPPSTSQDGLVFYDQQADDPEDYNFPFQDFPRKDGTPCLIYDEEAMSKKEQLRVFSIGDDDSNDGILNNDDQIKMETANIACSPLSDEAFAQMLANHSLSNSSFEDVVEIQAKSPQFTEKLDRLMQQKHRICERKAIVEKRQEQRAKERKQTREAERRERHRTMERDIADLEKNFSSNLDRFQMSPARPLAQYSPKPKTQYSPKTIAQYSPKRHLTYSPKVQHYSPKIHESPNMNGYAPQLTFRNRAAASPVRPLPRSPKRSDASRYTGGIPHSLSMDGSTSPPGGIEGEPISMRTSSNILRPRTSIEPSSLRQRNVGQSRGTNDLYIDTHRAMGGDMQYNVRPSASFDLDKLSMPQMNMPHMSTVDGEMKAPKQPSPQSVMDDIFGTAVPPPKPMHRRVNSFDRGSGHRRSSSGSGLDFRNATQTEGAHRLHNSHRRTASHSFGVPPPPPKQGHQRTPSKGGHKRSDSHSLTLTPSRRQRANSHSDDLFLHGVFTQSRFV